MNPILQSSARPTNYQNQFQMKPHVGGEDKYQPSPEEEEICNFVFGAYQEAKAFKKNFDKDWDRWYRLYAGQHWNGNRPDWKSDATFNFIFSTIETILPIMTDSNPQITVAPANPKDAETADVVGQCVKRIWTNNNMDLKLPAIVKNSLKYGTAFSKVWWNQSAAKGKGDVEVSVVDPRHFFPSPGALEIQEAAYIVYACNIPVSNIEAMYPDAKGKIEPGVWEEDLTVTKDITSSKGASASEVGGPVSSTDGSTTSWAKDGQGPTRAPVMDRSKLATLIEMWHRKGGQVFLTVCANGVVLRDGPSPFEHDKYPFVKFVDHVMASSFWGMGEIQQLEKPQEFINKRRAQTHDLLKICGNPPLIADSNSGINPKAISSRPGTIIYKNQGTEVYWLQAATIPNALFEVQHLDKQDLDAISGIFDVTQGRKPAGIEAASAIVELQEAAQTRIRMKVRNLEASLRQLGELIVATLQQFYTDERVIRIVGGDPSKPEFRKINAPGVDKQGNPVRINDVQIGEYDVEIGVGSTLPVNKSRRYKEVLEMYQQGVVDAQSVVENSNLSTQEIAKILSRMKQKEQMAMAMQTGQAPPADASGGQGAQPVSPPTMEELAALESA